MNFFDVLFRPDREEQPERQEVNRAANLLQVSEFRLLQLAHKDSFGVEMPQREGERLFGAYMLHDHVPHWARLYARQIIARDAADPLDDRDAVCRSYDPPFRMIKPDGLRNLCAMAALIAAIFGASLWFSHIAQERYNSRTFSLYVSD